VQDHQPKEARQNYYGQFCASKDRPKYNHLRNEANKRQLYQWDRATKHFCNDIRHWGKDAKS